MHFSAGTAAPRGTVTFLFTDMEGSTRLLQQLGVEYARVLEDQRTLARSAFEGHGGHLVDTAGDGQFFVFERARDALAATIDAQRALARHSWPGGAEVRLRMGLHTGEPVVAGSGYVGLDVHRAARIMSAAHGGQIVLSHTTRQLIGGELPAGVTLLDLGEHRLKDILTPERLFQVQAEGLAATFPPLRTAGPPAPETLPPRTLKLIGRDDDLTTLDDLLRSGNVRLLTLTGAGGTGKTSLAIEVASRIGGEFSDGVAYVPLAPVSDAALVFAALAQSLAVSPRGDQQVLAAVVEHLRERRMLVVLDNFEHVLAAADGVATLVAACPSTTVLVTSRFALRLSMEREYPVAPLRTPDADTRGNPALLRAFPAVELFAQRAAALQPGLRFDDESTVVVAEICRRLDGLPLAIELAAARVKLFSPRALLARLDRRLDLLGGGARDLPSRHRTLREAIGWSYDLLEPGEQSVFRRLAVFAGGCALESAEAVCSAAGDPGLPILDAIAALVDKSLLRREAGDDDEPRFVMLETVREFALERFEGSGEEEATRAAHADVCIAFAERAEPELTGPGQRAWLPRLGREHDDMRAAHDWAIRTADASRALRLSAALCRFWIIRGFHTEGRQRLRAALAMSRVPANEAVRARALSGAAILAYEQAALDEGTALLQEALQHFRDTGDERRVAETLNHLGWVAFVAADLERARLLSEEAQALHEKRGDVRGQALSLTNLGAIALHGADTGAGLSLYGRALELRRELKDPRGIAYGALNHAFALTRVNEFDRALELAEEAERILRGIADKQLLGFACYMIGEVALEREDVSRAVGMHGEAVMLGREVMQTASLGLALGGLAEALARAGDHERALALADEAVMQDNASGANIWFVLSLRCQGDARRLAGLKDAACESYARALRISARSGLLFYASEALAGLAALASADGDHETVMRMAGAAFTLRASAGATVGSRGRILERAVERARAAIGAAAAASAYDDGAAIELGSMDSAFGQGAAEGPR